MWFNHTKPGEKSLGLLPPIGEDWPIDDWKYADVGHVYSRTTELVRHIIDTAPLAGGFKRTLIDVKVQDLVPDVFSCIPGWHIDGAFPTEGVRPDHHHLCVLNGPQTEFIGEPIDIGIAYPVSMPTMLKQIPQSVRVVAAREGFITTFTSHDFHRGVKAAAPTRRLLVRLTETNTILARNKPKAPSVGAR